MAVKSVIFVVSKQLCFFNTGEVEVGGTPAYMPLIMRPSFLTSYIVSNIGNIPTRFIPTHLGLHYEDLPVPKDFSIYNKATPMLATPEGDFDEVFSRDKDDEDEYTSIVVLPPGWEQKTTDKLNFINHINKSTHWEVPDEDRLSLARETS